MLYNLFTSISLPSYSKVAHLEGRGNYAVSKYYKLPHSIFYQQKLKMAKFLAARMYYNCLDYGSGPGITSYFLKSIARRVKSFDKTDIYDKHWKFDLIFCGSVLEFCNLDVEIPKIKAIMAPWGHLIVASPMKNIITNAYFRLIGDKHKRNSHNDIISSIGKHMKIERTLTWMNLYFALRCSR